MPEEALLVRSAYLRNHLRASALVAEARRRAGALAVHAQDEAARLYREAKSEGYAAGMLQAAGALAAYLADHAALAAQLQQQLQREVAALLQRCVNDPEVVAAAFEECLREQDLSAATGLDLLLPEGMRANHRSLVARLQRHFGGQVNIEYRQDPRFLLRLGDQVAEFAPDDFVMRAGARAMSGLPSIHAASSAAADKCRATLAALLQPPQPRSTAIPSPEQQP
ncbi:hypothetical protein XthCFBP4691_12355 [Xanthomonas theicola]|uniref:Oxygen-regulated invasion protein OrgB n=1 Tax=Xanthomonas theicola TaxID=56464 RepID=A0A2S6ZDW3_9XANT|nr:hypothetical protein XthCFBP4691_12355 [Xanthomonas theicola]